MAATRRGTGVVSRGRGGSAASNLHLVVPASPDSGAQARGSPPGVGEAWEGGGQKGAWREALLGKLLRQLPQATLEKLTAIERFLAGQPLPDPQQNSVPARPPAPPQMASRAGAFRAAIEGDPASGRFCIRFVPANEAEQSPPPHPTEPDQETLSIAAKVFELLSALDPASRLRRAPPIKVFLLRFRQNLSLSDIARACGCARSLVALRLRTIREKLPWRPQQLRELSAHVEAMQEAVSDSRASSIYRKGAVYGGEDGDGGID